MKTTTEIEWQGHKIEFIPILSRRTFWMATLNELWFDNELIATSGGFKFADTLETIIHHDGQPVSIVINSSMSLWSLSNLNYKLIIDNKMIAQGSVKSQIKW